MGNLPLDIALRTLQMASGMHAYLNTIQEVLLLRFGMYWPSEDAEINKLIFYYKQPTITNFKFIS